jgi:hypothetical protein
MNQTKITRYDTEIMCSALNNGPHSQKKEEGYYPILIEAARKGVK